jgi:hypothetical protein
VLAAAGSRAVDPQAVMAAPAPSPTVATATAATAIIAAERLRFMMSPVVRFLPGWTRLPNSVTFHHYEVFFPG